MTKSVICIGAGPSQLPYLKEIKRRGYSIICADMNPDAPGFAIADLHVISSTFDAKYTPERLAEIVPEEQVVIGAIAPCTGPPYRTLQQVRKKFGLPYTGEGMVDILLDKVLLRQRLNKLGCSDIDLYNAETELDDSPFPLIRKPRHDGMGSQGVEIFPEYYSFRRRSGGMEMDPSYVYEAYIAGRELAIDAIWDGKKITFLSMGWSLFDRELGVMVGSTAHRDRLTGELEPRISDMLTRFCTSLELGPEVLNVDVVLSEDDVLHIIEVEFVPADGVLFLGPAYGYDMVKNFVSVHLGEKPALQPEFQKATILIGDYYNTGASAVFKDTPPGIYYDYIPREPYTVQTLVGERTNCGSILIAGPTIEQVMAFTGTCYPSITIEREPIASR